MIKIRMNNVLALDISFLKDDVLSNKGIVILDTDTYDFLGYLTDDLIIGIYLDGKYRIYYYYHKIILEYENEIPIIKGTQLEEFRYEVGFKKDSLFDDFSNNIVYLDEDSDIIFERLLTDDPIIEQYLKKNEKFIELKK